MLCHQTSSKSQISQYRAQYTVSEACVLCAYFFLWGEDWNGYTLQNSCSAVSGSYRAKNDQQSFLISSVFSIWQVSALFKQSHVCDFSPLCRFSFGPPPCCFPGCWLHCILLLGFATSLIPPLRHHHITAAVLTNTIGQSNVYRVGRAFTGGGNLAPVTIKKADVQTLHNKNKKLKSL